MKRLALVYLFLQIISQINRISSYEIDDGAGWCSKGNKGPCKENSDEKYIEPIYSEEKNDRINLISRKVREYKPCAEDDDTQCKCHANVIKNDLSLFDNEKITEEHLERVYQYGVRYQIFDSKLYRQKDCLFPARCSGIEHFLFPLAEKLPNMDLIINVRDYPQTPKIYPLKAAIFSFSKTSNYQDIMYPAWSFWEGGPAIGLHPTGIGRWDLMRERIVKADEKWPWTQKLGLAFFRGSRTSDERDTLVILSRRKPELADAKYTKNQAWKTARDTLNAEPASEVSFENHCKYKYLFNFRGVAASFRFKHLFLCKSLVFHVGDEWEEFFYPAMQPWVHYVPVKKYPTERELEEIITFFRENDDLAESIAERGFKFIWNHLRMEDVECYWEKLLTTYATYLNYTVSLDEGLILLNPKIKYY